MDNNIVKGYKVFLQDWTCRPEGNFKQYTCPGEFEEDVDLELCKAGMHFCKRLIDCFNYQYFDPKNKVAEVEAYGNVVETDDKCCTNKLRIIRKLSWHEVLDMVNLGNKNTGIRNNGSYNNGDCNSGNLNSGNCNSGGGNSGNYNSGNFNSGNCNSGSCNSGSFNSGSCNSGDHNSGYFNSGNYSSGVFNTDKNPLIMMFNKPSGWTYEDWCHSDAHGILISMPSDEMEWVTYNEMNNDEKKFYPEAESFGGYLKKNIVTDAEKDEWWRNLLYEEKDKIMSLPNFNKNIFKKITGIDVEK